MLLFIEILGALCMIVFMFIAIWSFIILNQIFAQFRYKNYLLEKLVQNVHMLSKENLNTNSKCESIKVEENTETDIENNENYDENKKVIPME